MREFLRTKGFKMTPQRELIFRAFFEAGEHVTVDEVYQKVRQLDQTVGYSTVWRNLKLICKVGLAEEVNLGDGVTRYDRVTRRPHGHFYCVECKKLTEFDMKGVGETLHGIAKRNAFAVENMKVEITGICDECRKKEKTGNTGNTSAVS